MSETDRMPAPAFEGETTQGKKSLQDYAGRKLVLYFYPKDNTSGCTLEGQNFQAAYEDFLKADCDILGVSRESIRSHNNFCAKQGFTFALLSDPDETVCRAYDVMKLKKMYGREYMGIERSTFVIDREGRVVKAWRKVKVPGHVAQVLECVQSLD